MSKRPGFMFYFDEAAAFERVSDSEAGVLIKAMIAYIPVVCSRNIYNAVMSCSSYPRIVSI